MWFLATPIGGASIAAGQHTGAVQLIARETREESLPSRVKTAHRYITVERPLGEDTAQYEGCRETQTEKEEMKESVKRTQRREVKTQDANARSEVQVQKLK